ncbi:MAG: phosphate/phosphite/phosphonate ABC transporter substrate-binding protein [Burkholderiaceae bacterium]|nr:phosphate/phosphite/phosphonate ABC transporter substrate-binding protein [Burkholderiaceae bacterium]
MDAGLRRRNRRRLLLGAALAPVATTRGAQPPATADAPLRFGTTAVFLDNQIALLDAWQSYLRRAIGRPVQFVQRANYRQIVDLLLGDQIEAAWLCGYPYVVYERHLALTAVPVYEGAPLYRSYLIVPATDTRTQHVTDLAGTVFAYSDALSNSGYLVPRVELIRAGRSPDTFFRRTFFTHAHRKVVEAVRVGLAAAGAVDGYVWDTLQAQQPQATAGVRVAWRSPTYAFPPIVVRRSAPAAVVAPLLDALLRMPQSPDGRHLLARLNIDGFAAADPALFEGIRRLAREMAAFESTRRSA